MLTTRPIAHNETTAIINAIPETVGQYTGMTDKNGKRIFEGDIIRCGGKVVGVVNYHDCCFCVRFIMKDHANRSNPAMDIIENEYPNDIEVIGNIHDNPELIAEVQDDLECIAHNMPLRMTAAARLYIAGIGFMTQPAQLLGYGLRFFACNQDSHCPNPQFTKYQNSGQNLHSPMPTTTPASPIASSISTSAMVSFQSRQGCIDSIQHLLGGG